MKYTLSILILALTTITGMTHAQSITKTIYLNALLQMSVENKSSYKLQLTQTDGKKYDGTVIDNLDQKRAEGGYIEIGKSYLEDGHFTFFHPNGKTESEGEYVRGVKVGTWKRYDVNGHAKADRYYPTESADEIRKTMELEKEEEEEQIEDDKKP